MDSVVELWKWNMSFLVDPTRSLISEADYFALLEMFIDLFLKELKRSWAKVETTITIRMEDLKSSCSFEALLAEVTKTKTEPISDKNDLALEFALDLTPIEHQIAALTQDGELSSP